MSHNALLEFWEEFLSSEVVPKPMVLVFVSRSIWTLSSQVLN